MKNAKIFQNSGKKGLTIAGFASICLLYTSTTLYSGSSGNCAVLEEAGRFLLIDMGKSCRQTAAALQALGLAPSGLAGILLTHEHADHVAGLRVFLKKWNVPVYGCAASLDYLAGHGLVPPGAQLELSLLHI